MESVRQVMKILYFLFVQIYGFPEILREVSGKVLPVQILTLEIINITNGRERGLYLSCWLMEFHQFHILRDILMILEMEFYVSHWKTVC